MASSKDYRAYILDQLSELDGITCRAMMGEYIIYYREKAVGGIYDDRFLVKPVKSALALMPFRRFAVRSAPARMRSCSSGVPLR